MRETRENWKHIGDEVAAMVIRVQSLLPKDRNPTVIEGKPAND